MVIEGIGYMKKQLLSFFSLLLVGVLLLTSCAKLPALKYDGEKYTNPKTGVSYFSAPDVYQAVSRDENAEVARLEQKGVGDLVLYAVGGVNTTKLLTDEYYTLFYATDYKLPTLEEMNPDVAYITQTINLSWVVAQIETPSEIAALISAFRTQKGFPIQEIDVALTKEAYDLKFASEDYGGFYYCVTYWQFSGDVLIYEEIEDVNNFSVTYPGIAYETEEYNGDLYVVYNFGSGILYDRITRQCYPAGDLVSNYLTDEGE